LTLVVLAAGIGHRYRGLKQIDPIGPNGEIIIDYSLYDAKLAGFDQIVFIIRKDIEEIFKEKIGYKAEKYFKVSYVFQELDSGLPKNLRIQKSEIHRLLNRRQPCLGLRRGRGAQHARRSG